jgi:hypothetical protein
VQDKRYRTSRVQLQDRQNKVQQTMNRTGRVMVQDKQGPATRQAKQGTGSAGNAQDRKGNMHLGSYAFGLICDCAIGQPR